MIVFWARVDESDVDNFVKTSSLPDYMSHLEVAPFSIAEQASSATGREPLKLVCFGPGRLEDLTLDPFQCASKLLATLAIGFDVERIIVPTSGAVWTWREFGPSHPFYDSPPNDAKNEKNRVQAFGENSEKKKNCADVFDDEALATARKIVFNERAVSNYLRVYFEPKEPFEATRTFDARDAYVSVSRREIFLSWRVVETYVETRCRELLKKRDAEPANFGDRVAPNENDETIAPPFATNARETREGAWATKMKAAERVDFAWRKSFGALNENVGDASDASILSAADEEEFQRENDGEIDLKNELAECFEIVEKQDDTAIGIPTETKFEFVGDAPNFRFALDGRRAMFEFGAIAGALDVDSPDFVEDALRFAELTRTLERLDDYVRFDAKRYPPRINELGLTMKLEPTPEIDENVLASKRRRDGEANGR